MTIDPSNYNTKCSKKMEEEEKENLRTLECLRGRLLAERQISRSAKEEAELITTKLEELERHVKEEIRLREKAEKRLKFLMKKLEFVKGSRSSEGSEQLSSSEVSCISSVCTSASKEEEEEEESNENEAVEEVKSVDAIENVASMEEESSSKFRDASCAVAATSSHEEGSKYGHEFSWISDAT